MNQERVEMLMCYVNRKLNERNIKKDDHDAAIKALSNCVLAGQLIKAYQASNHLTDSKQL